MKIAILCPTRGRPEAFCQMVASVEETGAADVLAYIDDDWIDAYKEHGLPRAKIHVGPRIGPVASANALAQKFNQYDAYGLITDDSTITTPGWDSWVRDMHAHVPLMVCCPHHNLGDVADMPFVTRRWINLMGWYACPEFHHWCWATISGLIGEMTSIAHAGKTEFHVEHDAPGGVHTSNVDRRDEDNRRFFEYVSTDLMQKVYLLREQMAMEAQA